MAILLNLVKCKIDNIPTREPCTVVELCRTPAELFSNTFGYKLDPLILDVLKLTSDRVQSIIQDVAGVPNMPVFVILST